MKPQTLLFLRPETLLLLRPKTLLLLRPKTLLLLKPKTFPRNAQIKLVSGTPDFISKFPGDSDIKLVCF